MFKVIKATLISMIFLSLSFSYSFAQVSETLVLDDSAINNPKEYKVSDVYLEILKEQSIVETGLITQRRFQESLHDGGPNAPSGVLKGPMTANLLFLSGDEVVLKLPILLKMASGGISLGSQIILDDDEWGFGNIDEIDGMPASKFIGTYHGGKTSLCVILGGSCFVSWGNEGLMLHSGNFSGGLDIDLSYVTLDVIADDPNDERWNSIIHVD